MLNRCKYGNILVYLHLDATTGERRYINIQVRYDWLTVFRCGALWIVLAHRVKLAMEIYKIGGLNTRVEIVKVSEPPAR